jgi:hypothetical protein
MDSQPHGPDHVLDYASPRARPNVSPKDPRQVRIPWFAIIMGSFMLAAIVALFMPALGCAHCTSTRVQCGTNEHQIVVAIFDYAQKNGGNLPPSMQLIKNSFSSTSSWNLKILQCPEGPGNYIYVGAGLNLKTAPKGTILLYEPPTNHKDLKSGRGAMNVGYVDGAVRRIVQPQADKIIAELNAGHNPPREEIIK